MVTRCVKELSPLGKFPALCHPERSMWFALRTICGVEGPHEIWRRPWPRRRFSLHASRLAAVVTLETRLGFPDDAMPQPLKLQDKPLLAYPATRGPSTPWRLRVREDAATLRMTALAAPLVHGLTQESCRPRGRPRPVFFPRSRKSSPTEGRARSALLQSAASSTGGWSRRRATHLARRADRSR